MAGPGYGYGMQGAAADPYAALGAQGLGKPYGAIDAKGSADPYGAYGAVGAVAYDAGGFASQKPMMGGMGEDKGTFLRGRRRRMNVQPLFLSVLVPWVLFSVLYAVLSFSIHYEAPVLCFGIVAAGFLAVVLVGVLALSASGRWFANAEREPTWLKFMFLAGLLAFFAAYVLGSGNYGSNMERYYNMRNLNNYTGVSPAQMRGQQLMDAGIVQFAAGTKLDLSKSNGFKNNNVYCVAPITLGDTPLATYDFWVVGKNCCSGSQPDFHCANFNNPHANGGLRLMSDNDRPFYRLAVQEAEASYNIKAVHPLFFEWSVEPMTTVEGWRQTGVSEYLVW
eukprot:CAMPEP_0183442132 /NCGR_PEP_ID=MMETSP0370-20130417/87105_1 /TAXON_ID=268820 /ORGANISM="Peridinium aciculiferum, Strain PAER-2" /LENGTH=335 /DNA_ID=CAMNT_0025631645 /DNA_START=67 /DNA_END=1071 /DNA_ORIENTATION=+